MARRFGGVPVAMLGLMAWSAAAELGGEPSQPLGAVGSGPGSPGGALAESSGEELLGSIAFAPRSVELTEAGKRSLEEVATQLVKSPESPIQVVAYAGEDGVTMDARRISLSRALEVRSFLVKHGVSSRRMIVKALGKQEEAMPTAERVDILRAPQ